ncbi:hypothetical protein DAT35_40810 [Vitiosangium sp. GDMCC 1.1324]|nr:hypothetical protein DAT35_40810 [Vitiosangium sp. GDMCC 1.1324]
MLTSGCLGHFYEIPRTELERLAQTPPQERGQSVYAVQQFTTAWEPEAAPPWIPTEEPPPGYSLHLHGYWVPSFYGDFGEPYYAPPPYNPPELVHDATPVSGSSSGGSVSTGGGGSVGNIGDIKDVGVLLAVAVVVGVAVGVGLAATEGARYEGQVAVHPHHPLHLLDTHGAQRIVALDELTLADLSNIDSATLSGEEGAGMWLRGAAPLNRKGFSYQFGAGYDSLALPGMNQRSLGYHFAFGYYPAKKFGLLAHTRMQFDDSFYNVRLGLEAQWSPIVLWRLHLGPFVGGGQSWSASAGWLPDTHEQRPYVSFGALAELEISTRLGLTFRWTQDWLPTATPDTRNFISSWSVGLAVY